LPKFGFQPQTLKPDNFGPLTLETVQFSTLAGFKSGFPFSGDAGILYYFLSILTSSNEKTQNYKVVDLIESYNFGIKSIFI
jgi:hypothetical protein